MEKKLYPFKFIPVASRRPWGGSNLVTKYGKAFVECDDEGNEIALGADELIGESWEIADMGFEDSVLSNGWLAGNTISEIMETYLERVVGEDVYKYFGRQFPLLVKFLDINGKLSVQVHPDDEIAAERYDALGKSELWYVLDAQPDANVYMGFKREVTAQEFYDKCNDGTVVDLLNVIHPKKGDVLFITPGTVHAVDGNIQLVEIQESSDLTFRLYDWGREKDPVTARPIHLEEAIDLIDYLPYDTCKYRKGPLWGEDASYEPCCSHNDHCCDHEHDHEHHAHEGQTVETLVESAQFTVSKLNLTDPLHIYTEQFGSFIVYVCIEGAASIQVPSTRPDGEAFMDNYEFKKGETMMIPADMADFYLVPRDRSTVLLEAVTRVQEDIDAYIDPNTDPYLEGEDYEGLEDGAFEDDEDEGPVGASPLGFFGAGRNPLS
ncbi:MAG: class I mannose-6-phosphate isomerase [Bacteroidales bacterium]|nr:class I mannose-6-phosphate isomerase [Bacteroidales bacterium]